MDMADRLNPRGELLCYGPDVAFRRTTALPYGDRQAGLSGLENGKWQNVLWMVRQSARFCHAFTLFGSGFPLWSNVLDGFAQATGPYRGNPGRWRGGLLGGVISAVYCGFHGRSQPPHRAENLRSHRWSEAIVGVWFSSAKGQLVDANAVLAQQAALLAPAAGSNGAFRPPHYYASKLLRSFSIRNR